MIISYHRTDGLCKVVLVSPNFASTSSVSTILFWEVPVLLSEIQDDVSDFRVGIYKPVYFFFLMQFVGFCCHAHDFNYGLAFFCMNFKFLQLWLIMQEVVHVYE